MIDIKLLREKPSFVEKALKRKGYTGDLEEILQLDERRRNLIKDIELLRHQSGTISAKGPAVTDSDRAEGTEIKSKLKEKEPELASTEEILSQKMALVPNLPLEEVPNGMGEADNKVLREVGEKRSFSFTPKDHLEIAEDLGIIDFEGGAKVAGSQFYYLKNEGVFLELALINFVLDYLRRQGFVALSTPDVARERFYKGTGYLPKGPEEQTYEIKDSDLGLIATSEITVAAYHADEIIEHTRLPLKYAAVSHCFRKEGGAYGKYSKGLYRVHQFTKVEMFAFTTPDQSADMHAELLKHEEEIFQGLEIPYRVVEMCAGELGAQAARKFDLEAWMPGRGDWGEVTSTSNTTDYQARNLNIRYKNQKGDTSHLHTLNGTALALTRGPIAILENYQNEDGSVSMPRALHPFLPFKKIGR